MASEPVTSWLLVATVIIRLPNALHKGRILDLLSDKVDLLAKIADREPVWTVTTGARSGAGLEFAPSTQYRHS